MVIVMASALEFPSRRIRGLTPPDSPESFYLPKSKLSMGRCVFIATTLNMMSFYADSFNPIIVETIICWSNL